MEPLLDAATDLVALLPPSRIQAIADRIRHSATIEKNRSLYQLVTTPAARAALDRLLDHWGQTGISGDLLAGILVGAAHARGKIQNESSIELVWTGPTTPFVATRRTEQVLLDLMRQASKELFLVSFVAYDVSSLVGELNSAAQRGVELRILLETSTIHGGSLSIDSVALMRSLVPSALLFAWTHRPPPFSDGRVHAKVAVADDHIAFLTSANLTGHAMEKNMEAGVVISGGPIPSDLRSHLHALIETKVIDRF